MCQQPQILLLRHSSVKFHKQQLVFPPAIENTSSKPSIHHLPSSITTHHPFIPLIPTIIAHSGHPVSCIVLSQLTITLAVFHPIIMSRRLFITTTALLFYKVSFSEAFAPRSCSATKRWQALHVSNQSTMMQHIEVTDIPSPVTSSESVLSQTSHDVFNSNMEFDLEAAELSAFTKTAAARASMGKFGTVTDDSSDDANNSATTTNQKKLGIESEFPKRKITAEVRESGTDSMKNYIKIMCNHELLNKNEEIILAREIQILLKWETERERLEEQLLR
jgi:hypothetical protein